MCWKSTWPVRENAGLLTDGLQPPVTDNCCYNSPFDDLTQERIHLESEAVLMILNLIQNGKFELIGSDALSLEMSRMRDPIKRQRVIALYSIVDNELKYNKE